MKIDMIYMKYQNVVEYNVAITGNTLGEIAGEKAGILCNNDI